MFDLENTLCFSGKKNKDEIIYFCADDLYGYYSIESIAALICDLQIRFNELQDQYVRFKELEVGYEKDN